MKNLRNVFASFTFFVAIGAAFATTMTTTALSRIEVTGDQGWVTVGAQCQVITVLTYCDDDTPRMCDIPENTTYFRYFKDEQCIVPFRKQ